MIKINKHGQLNYKKYSKMIATETPEHTEGKYSVLSVYSVAKSYTLYTARTKKRMW